MNPRNTPAHPAALLAHPDVVRAIEGALCRQGVRRDDLGDGVAEVQLRTLVATKDGPPPADVGAWKALACTIAMRMAVKDRQRRKRRSLYDQGLCREPDEHTPLERSPGRDCEALDVQRELLEARRLEHGEAIVVGVAEGRSAKDLAASLGLSEAQVSRRLFELRVNARNRRAVSDRTGLERH